MPQGLKGDAGAFDIYLAFMNALLRLPGHTFRLAVLRHLCRWDIGSGTAIERGVKVTTKGGVTVGASCNVNRGVKLDGRGGLSIGDHVNISEEVMILTADHDPDSPSFEGRLRKVVIGSRVWLATRALVLPGSVVGDGAVVAAGSIVAGEVAESSVVAGTVARAIRRRDPAAQTHFVTHHRWLH